MPTEPRPVTDTEREMVEIALRIVADIVRLDDLTGRDRTARIECPPSALRTAESLYIHAEQVARRSADPALLELVDKAPRPEAS